MPTDFGSFLGILLFVQMTALESAENEESLSAIAYLLTLVIKRYTLLDHKYTDLISVS